MNTGSDLKNIYNQCIQQEGDIPCLDLKGLNNFLNNETLKILINADSTRTWKMCNPDIQNKWTRNP
jgi:hypothetical protein